jgi:thymidylate kinase
LRQFVESDLFGNALAQDRARWQSWRKEYVQVHEALSEVGIVDVLIKSVGIAPSLPYASDNLDTLVPLAKGSRTRQALLDLGYVELRHVEEPHKFLFRKFHLGTTVSAIHLHEFVGWGTGFMDDASVLAGARPAPDDAIIHIPSPEDGLLITMAHAFFEDKEIKLGDLWKVRHVLRQHSLDWDRMYDQAGRRGWREGLDTCIWLWSELEARVFGELTEAAGHSFPEDVVRRAKDRAPKYCRDHVRARLVGGAPLSGEVQLPWPIDFAFSKRHYYRKVWQDRELSRPQKLVDACRHSMAGIRRRLPFTVHRPMLIALSGIDGAGKTCQAELLRSAFCECAIDADIVWSRGGSSRLTDLFIRLLKPFLPKRAGLDLTSDSRAAKVARTRFWLDRPLLRWAWTWLVVLDLTVQYWARVCWPLFRGRVVIADRYVCDALTELAVQLQSPDLADSLAGRVLQALSPRPELAYHLRVSVEEASSRKPEEMLDPLVRQARLLDEMAAAHRLEPLDGQAELGAVSDRLVREALVTFFASWPT